MNERDGKRLVKQLDKCMEALRFIVKSSDCKWTARYALQTINELGAMTMSKPETINEPGTMATPQADNQPDIDALPNLITLSEAAALLEHKHGKRVYRQTIKFWGMNHRFKLYNVNGWKVNLTEFVAWAARTGRLRKQNPTPASVPSK